MDTLHPTPTAPDEVRGAPATRGATVRRLCYLGPEGTFTELALRALPEHTDARLVPVRSADEAVAAVTKGAAAAAMLPLENSVSGLVGATLQALAPLPGLTIEREVHLAIAFCLLVRPGTTAERIGTVAGHPHAFPQVRDWLATHLPHAHRVPVSSNAAGAHQVALGHWDAALAPRTAAAHYGLLPLASGIRDDATATTRFVLVSGPTRDRRGGGTRPRPRSTRTSLLGCVPGHLPRVRARIDDALRTAGVDVPQHRVGVVPGLPARPAAVLIDLGGHLDDAPVRLVARHLRLCIPELRALGSYPTGTPIAPPPTATPADEGLPH
ncbi:prephenate dehydratase domain-containing protein [Streptomyces sp. WZ-12]|uniref:prephenate dehydratase domain-containing protein n=1 Tax=Streptomyces sp. WZ-12 TaxID=3030210 RepID=UPI00238118D9|nr:prephenate dehydratase domain-containing protein [Streptomyces sp. WZ-12]